MSTLKNDARAAREAFLNMPNQKTLLDMARLETCLLDNYPSTIVGGGQSSCDHCERPDSDDYGIVHIEHPESVASTLRAFATSSEWYGACHTCNYSHYMCDVLRNYVTHDYTTPSYEHERMQAVEAIAEYMQGVGIHVTLGLAQLFWLCDLPCTFEDVRNVFMDWDNRPELVLGSNFDKYLAHEMASQRLKLEDLLNLGVENA